MKTRLRKHIPLWAALFGGSLFATSMLCAGQDRTEILLDLLVKRGVLTSQDAQSFQQAVDRVATPTYSTGPVAATKPADKAKAPEVVTVASSSALGFNVRGVTITPFGFLDFTTVYRNTNVGSGIGTNFAGIPFNNTSAGQLSETRFSAQNSRLGLRLDSNVGDAKVLGYLETDFLGNAPTNLGTSSNAATLRMRVYFADILYHGWEFLAGQDWSMLTPNRKGISPLPSDIFFTSNMDTNYQAGLVWSRQPQIRAVYHASDEITAGLSLENPDQYAGGTNGSSAVTFPTGFNTGQVDTGAATSSPNLLPDVIAKLAYDTKIADHAFHAEVGGLFRTFKVNTSNVIGSDTAHGYGGSLNLDFELFKNFHVIGNSFISYGGGRYIFGQGPDFVINAPATATSSYTIAPVHAYSGIAGAEWQVTPKSLFFGYASLAEFSKEYSQQTNGSYVGYGYPGSPASNNHMIREFTLGETQTIWKNASYGALQLITQASYVERDPWSVAAGTPSNAHAGMIFFDIRYVLP